jgi:hypothetical protein
MRRLLLAICALVLCALLVAGLWPLDPMPPNEVSRLANPNGLEFGHNATIYSSDVFHISASGGDSFCSLEIWLQPAFGYVKGPVTILAFYTPDDPLQFSLKQYADELLVQRDYRDQQDHLQTAGIKIEHAFQNNEQAVFTITSSPRGTAVYENGAFRESSSRFGLSCKSFSGQLIIGNSPVSYNTWQGRLLGLAIFHQGLSEEQASLHYGAWTRTLSPVASQNDRLLALYSFGQGSSRTIHDGTGSSPDLYIPETFKILHKKLLTAPWEEFSLDRSYAWDILVNVGGFVPFGFFFCAFFTWDGKRNRAVVATIVLGCFTSLTIELLQMFIPSRSSGVTDIITNTLGTVLGVILCRWRPVQDVIGKLLESVRTPRSGLV